MAKITTALLIPLNDQNISLTGLSSDGLPTSGATVTATLVDENQRVVSGVENIPLSDVPGAAGDYTALLPNSFSAPPGDYTLRVTALKDGSQYYVEQPIRVPYLAANANPVPGALATVGALKAWFNIPAANSEKDDLYQKVINRFTAYALNQCNRSSFLVADYTERHNGNGGYLLCPRHVFPSSELVEVTRLSIDGVPVPAATSDVSGGFVADEFTVFLRGLRFSKGIQNVQISYRAGLTAIPTVLEHACVEACAYWLKKREFVGQDSMSVNGQTIVFSKEDVPRSVARTLAQFTRRR